MRSFKRGYFFFLVLLIMFMLIFSFSNALAKDDKKREVTVAIGDSVFGQVGGDMATFVGGAGAMINQTVFDSFLIPNQQRRPMAALASKYEIAAGWKYIDIFMRDDVKFHNGDPVTVEDAKYTIEQYLRDDTRYLFKPLWKRNVKQLEIINPTTLRIHLNFADWGFLGRLWWGGGVLPKAYRDKVGYEEFAKNPVGTGPFKWNSFKQDQWFMLDTVKNHYRKTPEYDSLKVILVPEHSTRLAMLRAGEVDLTSLIGPHVPQVKSDSNLNLVWIKYVVGTAMVFCDLTFPDEPSPFHDPRVRQAVSLAIDRKTICEKLLFGGSEPWGEVLAPITLGYDPSIKPDPYDPEKAKALLAEAGYPQGFDTVFNTAVTGITAEAIAASLTEVGIRTKVVRYEGGAWSEVRRNKKIRGLYTSAAWYDAEYQAPADLSDFFLSYMPYTYNTTKAIEGAIMKGMYAITDDELAAAGRNISKVVRDSAIRKMLWASHYPWGLSKRITRWDPQIGANPPSAFETIELKQ